MTNLGKHFVVRLVIRLWYKNRAYDILCVQANCLSWYVVHDDVLRKSRLLLAVLSLEGLIAVYIRLGSYLLLKIENKIRYARPLSAWQGFPREFGAKLSLEEAKKRNETDSYN